MPLNHLRQKTLAWLVQLPPGQSMLVKAACGNKEEARDAWRSWLSTNDLDQADWQDHKLLALIAQRLADIDPHNPQRARLRGLSKMHWATTQLSMRQAFGAVDLLLRNNIDVMLLKGAALDASGISLPGPRISGDLDILVPRHQFSAALQTLVDKGWTMKSRGFAIEKVAKIRPGMNLHLGNHGDIDVHHQPVHSPIMTDQQLDELWSRAKLIHWQGRDLYVPALNDQFLINVIHACRGSAKTPGSPMWPVNLSRLARSGKLDFDAIAGLAATWKAQACVEAIIPHVHWLTSEAPRTLSKMSPTGLSIAIMLATRLQPLTRTALLAGTKIFARGTRFFELPGAVYFMQRWISKRVRAFRS